MSQASHLWTRSRVVSKDISVVFMGYPSRQAAGIYLDLGMLSRREAV